jgi:hypothetical protein
MLISQHNIIIDTKHMHGCFSYTINKLFRTELGWLYFFCRHKKSLGLYGRKRALCLGLVLASLFCILVSAIPQSENAGKRHFVMCPGTYV